MTSTAQSTHHAPLPASIAASVWRGDELGQAARAGVPTGFSRLDSELPGEGWPLGAVTEILQPQYCIAEWRLLSPALGRLATPKRPLIVVAPPHPPYFGGLRACGLSERAVIVAHAASPAERLWVTEQAVKANGLCAVIAWLPNARSEQIRRLQACSALAEFPAFLIRPEAAQHEASPAPLRLHVRAAAIDQLSVRIVKRRGTPHEGTLALASVPPGFQPILLKSTPAGEVHVVQQRHDSRELVLVGPGVAELQQHDHRATA